MVRHRARGAPLRSFAILAVAGLFGACAGAAPGGSPTSGPDGSTPPSGAVPNPALLAELERADLAADDLAFLAGSTFEANASGPGTVNVVEHLASGDTVTFTVTVAPAAGGAPGLVSASSSTTVDRIEVHLEYLISSAAMPDEVRQSLSGVATAGGTMGDVDTGHLGVDVSLFGVTVDWGISKAQGTARDTAIRNILEGALPGKGGDLMRLVKAGFTVEKGTEIGTKLATQLAELDRLAECARNPTNPLTIKQYEEDPGARDRVLEQIEEARNAIIANTIVMELGVVNGFIAGLGPKWLGYAIGPGTAWSKETLAKLNQERLDEIKRAVTTCACVLVTESLVAPMVWHGERRDPLDTEWLIQGEATAEGYEESWLYRAVIDPTTREGPYRYEAIGTIAGGTLTKNGAGRATISSSGESVILTLGAISVTSKITAAGTTQSVTLQVPETQFTWMPVGSSGCASPG